MNQVLLILALAASAAALTLDLKAAEAEEGAGKCVTGTWRWEKRNSSSLREKAKPVSKIYYLNVKGSEGRHRHMKEMLGKTAHDTPHERFEAFNAKSLPKDTNSDKFKNIASLYSKSRYTPWLLKDRQKEVFAAIHISNYQVMEKILKDDPKGAQSDDIYMVLEDDTTLHADWRLKLKTILENTPAEWDILRIGYWGYARCGDKENNFVYAIQPPAKDSKALGDGHFYSGNTAYLVRPKSIPRILDIMRNSSFASIENVLMYPHRFPDGTDHQVLSYATAPDHMLISIGGGGIEAGSHR